MSIQHHAYIVEGVLEGGIAAATEFLVREYGFASNAHPDFIIQRYQLFSVEDARSVLSLAALTPMAGDKKALIIAAEQIYHEAQNALLKLLEEPPAGTVIILCVPQQATILPTVRSRVLPLPVTNILDTQNVADESAQAFLAAPQEKRITMIKKLVSGKDDGARRAGRAESVRLVGGIERVLYAAYRKEQHHAKRRALRVVLHDIEIMRSYLYDRAAPVRMILEHLAIITPQL